MRVKPSYAVVAAIVAVVVVYLVARPVLGHSSKPAPAPTGLPDAASSAPPLVQIALTPEIEHPWAVTLRGRTQALRTVVVRSETSGLVARAPILQGTLVRAGTVLCQLAVDARAATLDQAKAILRSKQLQMQASSSLAAKGFRAKTQLLSDEADLDSATASVHQAEVAMRQVNIVAPFTGVFDHRDAEIGAYLSPGQACGTMIQLDPLLLVGDVPETEVGEVRLGAPAFAKLVSGQTIAGAVRFVARDADPATRTYRVEVAARNPDNRAQSGLSAEISVNAGVGPAHLVPVSALVLDSAGRQGIRYVLPDGRVAFSPVKVLDEAPQGVWVSGMRGPVRVIIVGQSYVSEGQQVRVASR